LLADFQVGGTTKLKITKNGMLTHTDTLGNLVGFYSNNNNTYFVASDSSSDKVMGLNHGNSILFLNSSGALAWTNQARGAFNESAYVDTILLRDGAPNTLALRNGAGVPQTFRVYNTFLGTTANEWFEIDWKTSPGTVRLFTMHGGTGVARNIDISAGGTLYFGAGTSSPIRMYSNGVERWNVSATGHFIAAAHNQYDIGASGANSPRNVYVGNSVAVSNSATIGGGAGIIVASGKDIGWASNRNSIYGGDTDGIIKITNYAATDFNRLQFGGTTNLFPAIKRSSTTLQARLADDSAFAPIQGKLTTDTAYTGTVVAATGYITIYDSTGTAYRVPCAV
jgi:hypothetical protein